MSTSYNQPNEQNRSGQTNPSSANFNSQPQETADTIESFQAGRRFGKILGKVVTTVGLGLLGIELSDMD